VAGHELGEAETHGPQRGGPSGAAAARLSPGFAALAESLLQARTVLDVLDRVLRAGTALISGADLAGVSLRDPDGVFRTLVSTDPLAGTLDELQYRFGEGPGMVAAEHPDLGVVTCAEVSVDPTYPRWGAAAARRGVHGVLSVGLFPRGTPPRLGALNFYSYDPGGLDRAEQNLAIVLAAHAAVALAAVDAERNTAHLRRALDTRDVIGQAKGILMARRGLSADEAFELLRQTSQRTNTKLVEVAESLTQSRGDDPAPP
jgi:GAF domain-containing protein